MMEARRGDARGDTLGRKAVLVVDDDDSIREILKDFLSHEGYAVKTARNGRVALEVLAEGGVDLVLSDLKMPEMDGLELVTVVTERHPEVVTLMMTGYGTIETAAEAIKRGALEYVLKPFKMDEVLHKVGAALEQQRLKAENIELRASVSLYELAGTLASQVELTPTLQLVVETVVAQTKADRVSALLFPHEDLGSKGASTGTGEILDDHDLLPLALEADEAQLAQGARVFDFLRESPRTAEVRSLLLCPLTSQGRRLGVLLAVRERGAFLGRDRKLLTILADRAAAAVHNAQLFETLDRSFRQTVEAFVAELENRDRYTAGHSERVARLSREIALELDLSEQEAEHIFQAALLHDIGKLRLRPEELNKPSGLSAEELNRFKAHPQTGVAMLKGIPTFEKVLPAIGGHHEWFDGTGYPKGLAGEAIPLMARIVAVADAYDAMTSDRAYRVALGHRLASTEIERHSGTQFDPRVVDAFLAVMTGPEYRAP